MAQTNYTPISLYYSTTAAAVPVNTNLVNGELAINITDGKLFYKDNSGVVQTLATKAGVIPSPFTANGVVYASSSSALTTGSALTYDGTGLVVGSVSTFRGLGLYTSTASARPTINLINLNTANKASYIQDSSAGELIFGQMNYDLGGQVEGMRLTSTGLGIGTSSPGASTKLNVAGRGLFTGGAADPSDSTASGVAINYDGTTGFVGAIQTGVAVRPLRIYGSSIVLATSPTATPSATLDSSGNLGLGVTPSAWGGGFKAVELVGGSIFSGASTNLGLMQNAYYDGTNYIYKTTSTAARYFQVSGQHIWYNAPSGTAGNAITFTQAMTLDASGNLLVGTTSVLSVAGATGFFNATTSGAVKWAGAFENTNASPLGVTIRYGTDVNSATNEFLWCAGNTTLRTSIRSNGGIANYQANDANLSDRREKTNFAPAKSYLDVICAIPVQTFNYIDQNLEDDPGLTLGVVAQDVQSVAPELVSESNWGTADDPKIRLSIYQTDLQYALMKCIQEQQDLIQSLTDRIAQLEAK